MTNRFNIMSAYTVIGVDLGSLTCRCAELPVARRMPNVVRSKLSNESTPSVTFLPQSGDGNRQFGESVATKDITSPANTVADLKEWLLLSPSSGRLFPGVITKGADATLLPAQVLGFTLRQLLDNAPSYRTFLKEGGSDLSLVVAVPTAFAASSEVAVAVQQSVALCCGAAVEGGGVVVPKTRVVDESDAMIAYFHHLRYDSHESEGPVTVIVNIGHRTTSIVAVKALKGSVERRAAVSIPVGSSVIDEGLCNIVFENILANQKRDIKGHAKSYKKVLRECKKAKEILSSVDTAMVQLEGLSEDTDVSIQLSRGQVVASGGALLDALRDALSSTIIPTIAADIAGGNVRLECVGGGWRTTFLQEYLKTSLNVSRVGVTLDSNMCVAEGCAILGAAALFDEVPESSQGAFEMLHGLDMGFVASKGCDVEAVVPAEWAAAEQAMTSADEKFLAFSSAVDKLQGLIYGTQSLLGRSGNVKDETYSALSALLNEIDLLAEDEATTTEILLDTYSSMEAKVNSIPEVAAQKEKEATEEKRKEEEFVRLSKLQAEEKELTNDPQRLRVAQQRREQGATLFKQECWEEAQTRFVQALSILGQLYDTSNEEYLAKKNEISLSCHLNIASCCVKLGRWRIAISNCSSALYISPNHPKALFRRGQAHSAQGEFKEALADLTLASELTGGDAGVAAEIDHVKRKMDHEKQKEKKMYGRMFA